MIYLKERVPSRRFVVDANRGIPEQTMVVLLAAGKGTRMGRSDLVKVCFEIDSVPAINRQIAVFKRQRFSRFLVVVGARVDQVLETVSREHPGVLFVHQEPQLGTGHAAKVAAEALQAIGYRDYVLVTMGDKYIEENALAALVDGYVKQRADLALLTIPKTHSTEASAGRVIVAEDGQAQDIIEQVDLARQMIADDLQAMLAKEEGLTGGDVLAVVGRHIPRPQKQQSAVAELMALGNVGRADRPGETGEDPPGRQVQPGDRRQALSGPADRKTLRRRQSQPVPDEGRRLLPGRRHDPQRQRPGRILHHRRGAAAVGHPRFRRRAALSRPRGAGRPPRVGAELQFARRIAGHPGLRPPAAAGAAGGARAAQPAAAASPPSTPPSANGWPGSTPAGPP